MKDNEKNMDEPKVYSQSEMNTQTLGIKVDNLVEVFKASQIEYKLDRKENDVKIDKMYQEFVKFNSSTERLRNDINNIVGRQARDDGRLNILEKSSDDYDDFKSQMRGSINVLKYFQIIVAVIGGILGIYLALSK